MKTLRAFVLTVVVTVLALEGLFRLLPVSQGFYLDTISVEQPIARRVADRRATSSEGWTMANAVSVRINAQGYVSENDFHTNALTPVVALIGDGQIEAPRIPWRASLAHGLETRLQDAVSVYPVGMSGAPLSQYLVWYDYMLAYKPDTVVFFISTNDYVESFERYGLFPGFHYFRETADGDLDLTLRPYLRSRASRIVASSDVLAYVLNNLDGIAVVSSWLKAKPSEGGARVQRPLAETAIGAELMGDDGVDLRRMSAGARAMDEFFRRLGAGAHCGQPGKTKIIFAMNPGTEGDPLSDRFRDAAREACYPVAELGVAFRAAERADGRALTFPGDVQWSVDGQRVVVNAVAPLL